MRRVHESRKPIVIIGAGASGLFTAVLLAKKLPNQEIIVVERLSEAGKKIRATGNGRCNLSYKEGNQNSFHSEKPDIVADILARYSPESTQELFESLGLPLRTIGNGVYPASLRAESVLAVLLKQIEILGVKVLTETIFVDFTSLKDTVEVRLLDTDKKDFSISAEYLILAGGGKVQASLGSDGSVLEVLKNKKIQVNPQGPALDAVVLARQPKELAGTRVRAYVEMWDGKNQVFLGSDAGEILFNKLGLSGIPIMQLSGAVHAAVNKLDQSIVNRLIFKGEISSAAVETLGKRVDQLHSQPEYKDLPQIAQDIVNRIFVRLDLLPELATDQTESFWVRHLQALANDEYAALCALYPRALAKYLLKYAAETKLEIYDILRSFCLEIKRTAGWEQAQAMYGGVSFSELIPDTSRLKRFPNVLIAGELLDVQGDCGGYNLQWAWSSAQKTVEDLVTVNKD